MLKLRPHRSLPKGVDNDDVYLKLFKDIPRMDLEMLLPGTQHQYVAVRSDEDRFADRVGHGVDRLEGDYRGNDRAASGLYNTLALAGLAGGRSAMACGRFTATCKPNSVTSSA